jgi:hypothetical protein
MVSDDLSLAPTRITFLPPSLTPERRSMLPIFPPGI